MLPASYQVPAAVLLLAGGLLTCFAGHRLFRVVLGVYGFVAGALIATTVMGPVDAKVTLTAMLVGGLIGALILILAYFVGVALIGATLGAVVIHLIWAQLLREPHPLIVIAGTVAGALGALALQRYVIVISTGFAGAWSALVGGLALAGQWTVSPDGWIVYPLRTPPGRDWVWLAWLVLGAVGVIVQFAARPKGARRVKG